MNNKHQIKILFLTAHPKSQGGIANWIRIVSKHLKTKNNIQTEYIYPAYYPNQKHHVNRTLWDRIMVNTWLLIKTYRLLKKKINSSKIDVVHITTSGELAIIRDIIFIKFLKVRKIRIVYHLHFGRMAYIACKNNMEWLLIKKALQLSDVIITMDARSKQVINEFLPDANVMNLPNPIDLSEFPTPKKSNSKTIIFVGWVVKTKGIEELLVSWTRLFHKYPDWRLRIVGPYNLNYINQLKQDIPTEGVTFEGELPHEATLQQINDADIFILPSYTEGFPYVLIEAMSLAKPIVATSVGSVPDMLSNGCGIVIQPKKPEQIEEALNTLIKNINLQHKFGAEAYKKVCEHYSIEILFKSYEKAWML